MLRSVLGLKDIARLLRLEQNPPASKNDYIKVESGRAASIPVSKVFRYYNYFPDDFSILITFRAMSLTDVYLMAMYDYRKHLSLGVRIEPDLVSFDFEKNSPFSQSEWSVDFAVKVRKAQWHTLGISIQERNVTVFWDCKKAGSKDLHEKFSLIPDPLGELYVGKPRIVSSVERYEVSWREILIYCGKILSFSLDCSGDENTFFNLPTQVLKIIIITALSFDLWNLILNR